MTSFTAAIHKKYKIVAQNQKITGGISLQPLYHFTSVKSASDILKSDKLKSVDGPYGGLISFTRDKRYDLVSSGASGKGRGVRIEFDKNKLSSKFSIRPYNYWTTDKSRSGNESEERIKARRIDSVSKYITEITVMWGLPDFSKQWPKSDYDDAVSEYKELAELSEKKNIKFSIREGVKVN